jgi:enediyne biosynthesis protein CalE5
LISLK